MTASIYIVSLMTVTCHTAWAHATACVLRPEAHAMENSGPTSRESGTGSQTTAEEERLYGTWVAHDVDTDLGEVKIRLTFQRDGPVKIIAWSDLPLVGKVREKKGPYTVTGNTLSSDAIRGGTKVEFRFDGPDLIIRYNEGKTIRFTRPDK